MRRCNGLTVTTSPRTRAQRRPIPADNALPAMRRSVRIVQVWYEHVTQVSN